MLENTNQSKAFSLKECVSNRLGYQVPMEVAVLKLSNSQDKLCQQCIEVAYRMGHGRHEDGIHAYLMTEDIETDITETAIGIYQASDPFEDDDARTLYAFCYQYGALLWEKAEALQIAGVKMDRRDLWRCALDMQPVGLVCTTYIQLLLGLYIQPYKPSEVLEYVMNAYPGGALWTRDTNDEWYRHQLPEYKIQL